VRDEAFVRALAVLCASLQVLFVLRGCLSVIGAIRENVEIHEMALFGFWRTGWASQQRRGQRTINMRLFIQKCRRKKEEKHGQSRHETT
jgi:hypothetical protein